MGFTKQDIMEENAAERLRQRVIASRTKIGSVCKSSHSEYQAMGRRVISANLPVSDALETALSRAYEFMNDARTFFVEGDVGECMTKIIRETKVPDGVLETRSIGGPPITDPIEKVAQKTVACAFHRHYQLPKGLYPSIQCWKEGEIIVSPKWGAGKNYYPTPRWEANITLGVDNLLVTQTASIAPFDVDPIKYTIDTDEMVLNETTGKRKRKYQRGSLFGLARWTVKIIMHGDGQTTFLISPLGNTANYDYVLAQHRTAEDFEGDIRLLHGLVTWARQKKMTPEIVNMDRSCQNPDQFQPGELAAIDLVMEYSV